MTPSRVLFALFLGTLLPLLAFATAPAWWGQRGINLSNTSADDFAPANHGQLKNIAKAAVAEMDAKLYDGAGDELHNLVNGWSGASSEANDYAPLNIGQLKNVVRPFYDQLIAAGLADFYPWVGSFAPADDFAIANVGQVKSLFSFEIPTANVLDDPRGGRLAAGQAAGNLALEGNAVWLWGDLGADSGMRRAIPVRMTGLSGVSSVSAGDRHFAARHTDGTVITWGGNSAGQLGDGTTIDRGAPAAVPNLLNVASVKVGATHTLALRDDGIVLAWGENYNGQLGTGNYRTLSSPVPVVALDSIQKIAAGAYRSLALKSDGTLWAWGYDHYSWQNGRQVFSATPAPVPALTGVTEIAAGYQHAVAVKTDGTVWVWGSNYSNQLGNGGPWNLYQQTPIQVPNLSNISRVASAWDHSLALAKDGTVWAWGQNDYGQLGDGTAQPRGNPVRVSGLTDVIAIATNWGFSLAMKSDGTVWAWGDAAVGTLPGSDKHVPQRVGLGLFDTNSNGMDDRWEAEQFGDLNQAANADFDEDGMTNVQEFVQKTDPTDYFNGTTPIIEIISGNNQMGDAGTVGPQPLIVRVKRLNGQLAVNAPIRFAVTSGSAELVTGQSPQEATVRTGSGGTTSIQFSFGQISGISSRITAYAGKSTNQVSISFRVLSKYIAPIATPEPHGTPNPGASPGAEPNAPYRYAIIDLGKDNNPIRVANNGWVLLSNPDGVHRWRNGTMEHLTYGGTGYIEARDMNNKGVVVGQIFGPDFVVDREFNEPSAGILWREDSPVGRKISAPTAFRDGNYDFSPLAKYSSCSAITDNDQVFGEIFAGGKFLAVTSIWQWFEDRIVNACKWSGGLGSPAMLSNAQSTAVENGWGNWSGQMDSIKRANSVDHYIGGTLASTGTLVPFGSFDVTLCSQGPMIDGQAISFYPVDIDEAGIVIGSSDGTMVIHTLAEPPFDWSGDAVLPGSFSPIAINDHVRPSSYPNSSPNPPSIPVAVPQILAYDANTPVLYERQPETEAWIGFAVEEMIPSMDGWDSLEVRHMNDEGMIVGYGVYKDPAIPQAQSESHGFLLLPVELVPDYNRDGTIDEKDRRKVTTEKPWRFWINDDDDSGAVGGDDIPGLVDSDAKDAGLGTYSIDGVRDLVDFFPLYLDLKQMVEILPPAQFSYFLKQEHGALDFAYTDLKPGGGESERAGAFLKNLGAAQQLQNAEAFRITTAGTQLTTAFLNKIKDEGQGVILLEGRSATDKPLVLEVRKGSEKIAELSFQVKIDGVEQMFRHKNLLVAGGGSGGPADRLGEPANYPDNLASNKSFVMVHGYNVNAEAARGWGAEMFKRLFWTGSKAKFYNVTWYGNETQVDAPVVGYLTINYQCNVDNAFATADEFAAFIAPLSNVTVAAHSLGNMLVSSAIQDWGARPANYFMIDAAVAKESYDDTEEQLSNGEVLGMEHPEWASYNRRLWASDWHLLFGPGDNRKTLNWENRLENVGSIPAYNFYSTGEEVLKNPSAAPSLPRSADEVWNNQERLKGRMLTGQVLSSNYGGWAFNNYWDVPDTNAEPDLVFRHPFPKDTNTLTDAQLRTNPFFRPGATELYGASGSNYASPQQHRNTLLAEMIPALSFAAGSNRLESRGDEGNLDMMSFKEGWPRSNPDWRHSDVKIVAYVYIYKMYEKVVELGALKQ